MAFKNTEKHFSSLGEAIHNLFGEERTVTGRQYVSGGDINEAYKLTLDDGSVLFMKSNLKRMLPGFEAETEGLASIQQTRCIGSPQVLGLGTDGAGSFLLLQFIIGGKRVIDYWETFASELAAMHRSPATDGTGFGYPSDNFIGAREQINTPHDHWISFFRDCRLSPQFADAQRFFGRNERKQAEYLLAHLDRYLTEPEAPSLVHGDLWSGNMITGNDGKGWLIDPAVYYGHPEADLAMTELFGGFPETFYRVYKYEARLEPGYEDRRDLYNLYQLLNHLNMFGGSYLGSVRRILTRYAG